MTEAICVCGHTSKEHGALSRQCYGADGCFCPAFRPCLPWPDSEGEWRIETKAKIVGTLCYARPHRESFEILFFGRLYVWNRDEFEEHHGPARFTKLLEKNPFGEQK